MTEQGNLGSEQGPLVRSGEALLPLRDGVVLHAAYLPARHDLERRPGGVDIASRSRLSRLIVL